MFFDKISRNHIVLDFDNGEQHVLTLETREFLLGTAPSSFHPKQMKTSLRGSTFITQDAILYSNAQSINFWRVLITKHVVNTTKVLAEVINFNVKVTT